MPAGPSGAVWHCALNLPQVGPTNPNLRAGRPCWGPVCWRWLFRLHSAKKAGPRQLALFKKLCRRHGIFYDKSPADDPPQTAEVSEMLIWEGPLGRAAPPWDGTWELRSPAADPVSG
jgi:hypothetical protein